MLVILSWISFWFNRNAANVRLTISGLAFLLIVIGCQTLSPQLPKTNYMKVIDLFTGVSIAFAFFSLIGEFVGIN